MSEPNASQPRSSRFAGEPADAAKGRAEENTGERNEAATAVFDDLEALRERTASLEQERDEFRGLLQRTRADFENYQKRAQRDLAQERRYCHAGMALDLLPILDNFERAVAHARPQDLESDFGQGILIIRKQLAELWKRYGLIPIDTSGAFDPNLHEAVATEKTDRVPPNTIVEELQKGFFLNDKLIRPAFVKVAVRPGDTQPEDAPK